MRTRLKSKSTLLFVTFAALLLAVAGTTMALTADPSGSTAPAPTIQSDEADYPPGATVTLTGSNWQPGESVHINVNDDVGQTWSRDADVTADASGQIQDQFQLPDWFVATYKVTATGAQSGVATTSFTDGTIRVKAGPSGTTFSPGTFTRYNQLNCAGPVVSSETKPTVGSANANDYSIGLGNSTDSLLVKVPAYNDVGNGFKDFTAESGAESFIVRDGAFDPTSDPKIVCINANYNGNRNFFANYFTSNQARHMELLPKRPPAEQEESEEEFTETFGTQAASRFDAALEWINPLVGRMPYGLWTGGVVPSGSPAWAISR